MMSWLRRGRNLGLLAVALIAAGAGLAVHFGSVSNWLERDTIDARFSLRGSQSPPRDVAVVGIDERSLASLPRPPIPRRLHATVVEHLHAAGARLIAYDVSFDRPTNEADLVALLEAARLSAPVVFATSLITQTGQSEVLGGRANLAAAHTHAGATFLPSDHDGVLRRTAAQVNRFPTFAAVVSHLLQRHPASKAELEDGWIDYRGPPGTVTNLSFVKVLKNEFDPALVRGKVVVVGATAPVLQDEHAASTGSPMSGPEVQANAIDTVLRGFPLRSASEAVTILSILLLALLAPLAALRFETLGVTLVGLGALVAYTLATQLAFDAGVVLEYSGPLVALVVGTGGSVIRGMYFDARERKRLRMQFAAGEPSVVEQVLQEPRPRLVGPTSIIAGYRIDRALASGGMGIVYRATQLALERPVAVKLISAEHAEDPEFRDRFKVESKIAASIEHPNVIPVYEAGEDDGLLFISMRLVEGVDLEQVLSTGGPLEPKRAARLILQIAAALDAAHARGLVHRDVKPANVLLTLDEPEHAYLTDFGVAKRVGANRPLTNSGQWVGTLDYLAPEQIRGDPVEASADIYMLAGLLYHCLTGRPPFVREDQAATLWAHLSAPPPAPSEARTELPARLDIVIARGLAKDPSARYSSAGELAVACAEAVGIEAPRSRGPVAAVRANGDGAPAPPAGATVPTAPTVISE
jgi:CHASE2 domain-containing sensor protein